MADYTSRDTSSLNDFLQGIGPEYTIYTYSMLNAGVDKESFRGLSDEQLENECRIVNSIHRLRILNAIRGEPTDIMSLHIYVLFLLFYCRHPSGLLYSYIKCTLYL